MRLVDILLPFPASVPPFDLPSEALDLPSEAFDLQLPLQLLLPRCQTVFQASLRSKALQTCFLPSASAVSVAVDDEAVDAAVDAALLLVLLP